MLIFPLSIVFHRHWLTPSLGPHWSYCSLFVSSMQWLSLHRAAQKVPTTKRSPRSRWNQTWHHLERRKMEMKKKQSLADISSLHQSLRRRYADRGRTIVSKFFILSQYLRFTPYWVKHNWFWIRIFLLYYKHTMWNIKHVNKPIKKNRFSTQYTNRASSSIPYGSAIWTSCGSESIMQYPMYRGIDTVSEVLDQTENSKG